MHRGLKGSSMSEFFKGKHVLVTGHTGFKGSWLVSWLLEKHAIVSGISLESEQFDDLFHILNLKEKINHFIADIRDFEKLNKVVQSISPEIIFHLAAQPIVLESFVDPYYTHTVNFLGTLNLLEVVRHSSSVKQLLVITTDKVYEPNTNGNPHDESDRIGGIDPYSASKAAVEILTKSYFESHLYNLGIQVATARAGNVIGFGDYGKHRLIPDLIKSISNNQTVIIRNPKSIRPWQDVNDVVSGYMLLVEYLFLNEVNEFTSWNFGPNKSNVTVNDIVDEFQKIFPSLGVEYKQSNVKENFKLLLNTEKTRRLLNWTTTTPIDYSMATIAIQTKLLLDDNKIELIESLIHSIKSHPAF